jgi:hypothetical protein
MSSIATVGTKSIASFQSNRSASKSNVEQTSGVQSVLKTFNPEKITAADTMRFNARRVGYLAVKNISQFTEYGNVQGKTTATFNDSLSHLKDVMTSVSSGANIPALSEEKRIAADSFMKELFAAIGSQNSSDNSQNGAYSGARPIASMSNMSDLNGSDASHDVLIGPRLESPLLSDDAREPGKFDYLEFTNVISKYLDTLISKLSTDTTDRTSSRLLRSASNLISTHEISSTTLTLTNFLQKLKKNMGSSILLTGNIIDARV